MHTTLVALAPGEARQGKGVTVAAVLQLLVLPLWSSPKLRQQQQLLERSSADPTSS